MEKEQKILENFKVEELEQRFEMGWIGEVKVGVTYEGVGASVTFEVQ